VKVVATRYFLVNYTQSYCYLVSESRMCNVLVVCRALKVVTAGVQKSQVQVVPSSAVPQTALQRLV